MNSLPSGGCILIVDDHVPTVGLMARLVQARGFRVVTARSLAEARRQAATGQIGFLICDLGLPDGDGCVLMAELRDRFGTQGAAISGYGMESDLASSRAAGFVLHLTKPIQVSDLDRVLELARREMGADRADQPPPAAS